MDPDADLFRIYEHVGADGYPPEWHETIKYLVREQANHRCVRCFHPYIVGAHPMESHEALGPNGEIRVVYESWSPCSSSCQHAGPYRFRRRGEIEWREGTFDVDGLKAPRLFVIGGAHEVEALARILTVHHLNGDKADCRWWNLASLCQRCHLRIQRTVVMPRVFPWEHSEWFKPYAAGWYAHVYLGEDLTREETLERLDELLALERIA